MAALAAALVLASVFSVYRLAPQVQFAWSRAQATLSYYAQFGARRDLFSLRTAEPAAPVGAAEGVPVLLYHGEGGDSDMSIATFVDQLRTLKDAGWQTITLEQFEDFLQGKQALPDKSFLLTFDDGRTDSFYAADPVLQDLGYLAVMYVVTEYSMPGGSDAAINPFYLNKSQLRYMARSGRWQLESHGAFDHFRYDVPTATSTAAALSMVSGGRFLSNKFWVAEANRLETDAEYRSRVTQDLADSKRVLEAEFGRPVTTFAYPFSDAGEGTVNFPGAARALDDIVPAVYAYAFYQITPQRSVSFNAPGSTAYRIKRFEPQADWSGKDLLRVLEGAHPKPLPYKSLLGADWRNNWGAMTEGAGTLLLNATPRTAGASAMLSGSERWRDYAAVARVRMTGEGSVTLIARESDDDNKLYCTFMKSGVQLVQFAGGRRMVLDSAAIDNSSALREGSEFGISVIGAYGGCRVGDTVVVATNRIDPRLRRGAAGLQTWSESPGAAAVEMTSFSATTAGNTTFGSVASFLQNQ